MTVATRLTRGPYRIVRRLARKAFKPLLLSVNRHQVVLSDSNVRHLEDVRIEAISLLQAEHRRQVQLAKRRRELEAW